MNITIDIKDKRYTVDEEVAQYLFCLKMQIASLNKALELAHKTPPVERPFKGKR